MGPKPKKRGKKGGKNAGTVISEIDKAFYELQITDLNRKLARLRSSYAEIEDKLIETQNELKHLDEDRADIIAYLERALAAKNIEIEKLQAKIIEMEESRNAEIKIFKDQVEQVKREYKIMQQDLTSKIKLLSGKLNSLEEYRQQRNDLMTEFEQQEEQIHEQEERHKTQLYEIERKFITKKDFLKKEMENRLLQLSSDFQKNTEMRIAATTQRVIHENIALNKEFDTVFSSLEQFENENMQLKDFNVKIENAYNLCQYRNNAIIKKAELQNSLIQHLTMNREMISKKLIKYENIEKHYENRLDELYNLKRLLQQEVMKNKKLLSTIYIYKDEKYNLEVELSKEHSEMERMRDIIYNASVTIHKILDYKTVSNPRNILKKILKILNRVDEEAPARMISLPTISSADAIEDIAVSILPKVKPYKYLRNVENKTTSITSSLARMTPIYRKIDLETEEMIIETETNEEVASEEMNEDSLISTTSSSNLITDFIISVSSKDNYSEVETETVGSIEQISEELKSEEFEEDYFKLIGEKTSSASSYMEANEEENTNIN